MSSWLDCIRTAEYQLVSCETISNQEGRITCELSYYGIEPMIALIECWGFKIKTLPFGLKWDSY